MAMHILLLRREHVLPLLPLICSLLITIQIFAMVPSSKKPFPDNVPLPFQADLFRSTSPRPPYLGCVSITAYRRTVPALVSPARMYYTPLGKISIPSTSPGLTLWLTWHLIKLAPFKWHFTVSHSAQFPKQTTTKTKQIFLFCIPQTYLFLLLGLPAQDITSWLQVMFSLILYHMPTNLRRYFNFTVDALLKRSPRLLNPLKPPLCGKMLIPLS